MLACCAWIVGVTTVSASLGQCGGRSDWGNPVQRSCALPLTSLAAQCDFPQSAKLWGRSRPLILVWKVLTAIRSDPVSATNNLAMVGEIQ